MKSISIFFFLLHLLLLLVSTTADNTTLPSNIAALKAFKAAIDPASISPDSCLATWKFTSDPCFPPPKPPHLPRHFACGVDCSGNRVIHIDFPELAGYAGTLSPLISQLTSLTGLYLANNKLYGPIPTSIFSLPNLQLLNLYNNSFSGTLPPVIPALKTLQYLDLSRNSLSGLVPDTSTSLSLNYLILSYNKFTGPIPKLSRSLNTLGLSSNNISGGLQKMIFNELKELSTVDLSNNSLTGPIHGWFLEQPSLWQVNLSHNGFIAIEILKPTTIFSLDAGYNKIVGNLSGFKAQPQLRWLSLRHNKLKGPIPKELNPKTRFESKSLFLDGNYLNGKPSKDFFSKNSTVTGSFWDNCLEWCPKPSKLCSKSQKPPSICRKAYGGK